MIRDQLETWIEHRATAPAGLSPEEVAALQRLRAVGSRESFANSDGSGLFVANRSGATESVSSGAAAATTMPGGAGNLFVCAMNPNEANPSIRQQAVVASAARLRRMNEAI
jgi:hypothetical protein